MNSWVRSELERKQWETDLERTNDRLEEFVSVVSHDLRNPLNVANGSLELVQAELDDADLSETARTHLAEATQSLERMETLIKDLLTMARDRESELDLEPIDLSELCVDCWNTVDTTAASVSIETDRTIQADENRLKQLFENLFRNSIEHSSTDDQPSAGETSTPENPDVQITVGETSGGFYVADDGPGIPPEERDKVFETGYSTATDGTGFGLSIVKQVADAHDWTVTVTASEQDGARFEFGGVEFA
jgi:signal transduction histidine kinase